MIIMFLSLIVVMNPLGNLAIYISMIDTSDKEACNAVAKKCAIAIFFILTLCLWAGTVILKIFGITTGSFEVAGGLIIILMALPMIEGRVLPKNKISENSTDRKRHAVYCYHTNGYPYYLRTRGNNCFNYTRE